MALPSQLHSFFTKQYEYFVTHDFRLYYEAIEVNGNLFNKKLCIVHKNNYQEAISNLPSNRYDFYPIRNADHYIEHLNTPYKNTCKNWTINSKDDSTPGWDSIKFLYTSYLDERKTILSYFNGLSDVPLTDCFEEFFNLFCNNKKDILSLIKSFPKTSLGINTIELTKLDNYLSKNGFTDSQLDNFFYTYFKNRETKLNLPENFAQARDFLLDKYEENQTCLEIYFPFFPALKDHFSSESIDNIKSSVFQLTAKSTVLDVDLTILMKKLLIEKYDVFDYRASVNFIRRSIGTHFNVQEHSSNEPMGKKNVERLVFLHNNSDLTQEIVSDSIVSYLLYLKEQPAIIKNDKDTSAWLAHHLLTKKINNSDIKNKISNNKKKI